MIGTTLKSIRSRDGLTVKQAAAKSRIPSGTWSNYETNGVEPRGRNLDRLLATWPELAATIATKQRPRDRFGRLPCGAETREQAQQTHAQRKEEARQRGAR